MFTISNEADYALLLVSQLEKSTDLVPMSTLIESTHLPKRFVARIASKMVKGGLLQSKEGKVGGYRLSENWDRMSLYKFLSIFEKNIDLVKCQNLEYQCAFESVCQHKSSLKNTLTLLLRKTFANWTIGDVVKRSFSA